MYRKTVFAVSLAFLLFMSGCSLNRLAVRQLTPVLQNSADAVYEETDLQLAEQALASNLKLLEGLLKTDPGNRELLLLTVQGFAGYALGFAEDEDPRRARELYRRARSYGMRLLKTDRSFSQLDDAGMEQFSQILQKMTKKELPALFWTGFSWAGYLNLSLDQPAAFIELPKVEAMMQRVMELDSTYFYGGAHLFFGSLNGMKPRMLGGNPQLAKSWFERNLKLTDGKFLLTYIYLAKYYAAKTLNEEAFDAYLNTVLETPADVLGEMPLLNAIAKKKARYLKSRTSDLF
jgi:hypothetical protein